MTIRNGLVRIWRQQVVDTLGAARKITANPGRLKLNFGAVGSVELASGQPGGFLISPMRIRVGRELRVSQDGNWVVLTTKEMVETASLYCVAAAAVDGEPNLRLESAKQPNGQKLEAFVRALLVDSETWRGTAKPLKTIYVKTHDPTEPHFRFRRLHVPVVPPELLPNNRKPNKPRHSTP